MSKFLTLEYIRITDEGNPVVEMLPPTVHVFVVYYNVIC